MKRVFFILGLCAVLAGGSSFKMNSFVNQMDTEKSQLLKSDSCVTWKPRKNHGYNEIKVTNNCSSNITVTYKYWNNRWVSVKFGVKAGTSSLWWPADQMQGFSYRFDD